METELKNGSKIKLVNTNDNIRSKRSELIGFMCGLCGGISESIPLSEVVVTEEGIFHKRCLLIDNYINNRT